MKVRDAVPTISPSAGSLVASYHRPIGRYGLVFSRYVRVIWPPASVTVVLKMFDTIIPSVGIVIDVSNRYNRRVTPV